MKMAAFMDKVQFLVGLSMKMACFMDERGGQVGLSMKMACFMDSRRQWSMRDLVRCRWWRRSGGGEEGGGGVGALWGGIRG
jgi:hypothetical protein